MTKHLKHHVHVTYLFILGPVIGIIAFGFLIWAIFQFQDNWNLSHALPVAHEKPFPTVQPFTYGQSNVIALSITPMQNNCPDGFYFYKNDAYSLCYPSEMNGAIDLMVADPAGSSQPEPNVLIFSKNLETITIVPSFSAAGPQNPCATRETTTVSGFPAIRITNKLQTNNSCGKVTGISTIVQTGKKYPSWLIYQALQADQPHYIDKYSIIEKTLHISQ